MQDRNETQKSLLEDMYHALKADRSFFAAGWLLVFLTSFAILSYLGLTPEWDESSQTLARGAETAEAAEEVPDFVDPETPVRIVIDKIDIDTNINNPESRQIEILDESLKSGVVHYPGSSEAGAKGNLFLFGHSSYLPVVRNKYYKVFNNLEELSPGDTIEVYGESQVYTYRVFDNRESRAEDAIINLESDRRLLTLSTCNSFRNLDNRFIVESELVSVRPLGNQ